jgi:hypothetical protein
MPRQVECGEVNVAATDTMRVYAGRGAITQLMLGVVCAAIYGAALWATSFLPTIPGVTWVRPANMLSELYAVSFGWTGALAAAFGNSLGDLLRGQFNPTLVWWVFPLEAVCTGLVVYWFVTDPSLRTTRGKIEWLLFAVVAQGLLTGFGLAIGLSLSGVVPAGAVPAIGVTITLNEGIPAIASGFVQYALFPRIVRMGLWWGRDLDKSNVPPEFLAQLRS